MAYYTCHLSRTQIVTPFHEREVRKCKYCARARRNGVKAMLFQYFINSVAQGSIYLLIALAFACIYNATKVFHIAHGAVFSIGAFAAFALSEVFAAPLFISIPIAMILCGGIGVLLKWFCYRPLVAARASAVVVLLTSLALYSVLINLLAAYISAMKGRFYKAGRADSCSKYSESDGSASGSNRMCIGGVLYFLLRFAPDDARQDFARSTR